MALAEAYSGTQTATISTEHVLNTTDPETTDGIYQLIVNLTNLAAGDRVELAVKEKVVSAGTAVKTLLGTFSEAQSADNRLFASATLILLHGWSFTLKQTAGTGRAFEWSIRKVA